MGRPLKFLSGIYFVLLSLFCLAGVNSYTYLFLVQDPPYLWLSWFARHSAILYWVALALEAAFHWKRRRNPLLIACWSVQVIAGIGFTWSGAGPGLHDWSAYAWSMAMLLPVLLVCGADCYWTRSRCEERPAMLPYLPAVALALLGAIVSIAATWLRSHVRETPLGLDRLQLEMAVFTVADFLWLAILATSVVNVFRLVTAGTRTKGLRPFVYPFCMASAIGLGFLRFLNSTLGVKGWPFVLYACILSPCAVCLGRELWQMLRGEANGVDEGTRRGRLRLFAMLAVLTAAGFTLPTLLDGRDWNGLLTTTFHFLLWMFLGLLFYALFPRRDACSVKKVLVVAVLAGSAHWMLYSTAFLWARAAGLTSEEIAAKMYEVRADNDNWQFVESVLYYRPDESCGEWCRTVRQYTNLPNAKVRQPILLADELRPSTGKRPNIFIFVIDSLRPDYVGAYNPAVDFTPNLDLLARDSIVMRKAFTQYAGTSLSEPAIWAGSLLLHAHYMRPFDNVNSLRTLALTDGYDMAVSNDYILRSIMPGGPQITRFDTGKALPEFEISSTLQQLTAWMEKRPHQERPIFFYCQPMNVHQLAQNKRTPRTSANWRHRPGFSDRVAYELHQTDESLGEFIRYLKAKGIYDDSILVVTADHGEAMADLPDSGVRRRGHSFALFPEIMRVPLLIHLPAPLRSQMVWDENHLAATTDITPSLYYLLGHRSLKRNSFFGRSMFAQSAAELRADPRDHLLLASDSNANYGILSGDGRFLYSVYDAPTISMLFDLENDPKGTKNLASEPSSRRYNEQILHDLQSLAAFYEYRPTGGNAASFAWDTILNRPEK